MLDQIGTVMGVIAALSGLYALWRTTRESQLRREDVLAWSNETITALEGILLVCMLKEPQLDEATAKAKMRQLMFDTAILVERGRMFFRNVKPNEAGQDKEPAYRGYRPLILDHIVVAHQIACAWPTGEADARLRMRAVAEDCVKKLVSLLQKEVGRSRTASADTSQGGEGTHLRTLLQRVDGPRLARLRPTPSLG